METTLAILFADVCDSMRLYDAAGNVRATEIIQGALRRVEGTVVGHGGRVVKSLGDGIMCAFLEASTACSAAQAMLDEIEALDDRGHGVIKVRMRIGLHFGSVVDNGSDIFGDAANVAARVQSLASPGEILLTEDVVSSLPAQDKSRTRLIDATMVKGKTRPLSIYKICHDVFDDEDGESTVVAGNMFGGLNKPILQLRLTYGSVEVLINPRHPKVVIGRSENSGIVILSRNASRQHCAIELAREAFMLTDYSSNGTFIRARSLAPVLLRRDTTKLVGDGLLGLGAVPEHGGEEHVVCYTHEEMAFGG